MDTKTETNVIAIAIRDAIKKAVENIDLAELEKTLDPSRFDPSLWKRQVVCTSVCSCLTGFGQPGVEQPK